MYYGTLTWYTYQEDSCATTIVRSKGVVTSRGGGGCGGLLVFKMLECPAEFGAIHVEVGICLKSCLKRGH